MRNIVIDFYTLFSPTISATIFIPIFVDVKTFET